MALSGILAGAMAGGGQAIQQNAQNTLEKQREEALLRLDRDFKRENLDYEYGKKSEIQQAQAQADATQSALDRQAELDRIKARGEQERITAEREAQLTDEYDTAENKTANQRDFELLTSLRDADGNRIYSDSEATATVFNTDGGISYSDAMKLVSDQYESMNISDRRNLQNRLEEQGKSLNEYLDEQAVQLIERAKEVDYGRSGRAPRSSQSQQSNQGEGIFSFANGNTLIRTPSGGVGEMPDPNRMPDVFQRN